MADNLEIPSKCNEDVGVIVRIIATHQLCTAAIERVVTIYPQLFYFIFQFMASPRNQRVPYVVEANKMS